MDLKKEAVSLQDELVELRRYFHIHPEKSWEEYNTQKVIMDYLDKLSIHYQKVNKTGIIAKIEGKNSSDRIIGIRSDMDAMEMEELTTSSYKSENKGCMHSCGHDAHMAILLGTAKILSKIKDELKVKVYLLFQPAEEWIIDSGATYMKDEEDVLDCDRIIALHIWSKLEAGYASLKSGPIMVASDTFDIVVKGKGGHGAIPNETIDPILVGCDIVNDIQRIVSREISPKDIAVVSVTAFNSGSTSNTTPDTAVLKGTTRTFSNEIRRNFPEILERICDGAGRANRAEVEFVYHPGNPVMLNDDECVETGLRAANKVFGKEYIVEFGTQMNGEDFAKYKNPKCLLILGGGFRDQEKRYPQHSPYFDINERVLKLGVEYFVEYVLEYQNEY